MFRFLTFSSLQPSQHDAVETADMNNEIGRCTLLFFISLYIICNLCLHLALFGDIILIVLLHILNCCVDPVPVRNDYFGGGVSYVTVSLL